MGFGGNGIYLPPGLHRLIMNNPTHKIVITHGLYSQEVYILKPDGSQVPIGDYKLEQLREGERNALADVRKLYSDRAVQRNLAITRLPDDTEDPRIWLMEQEASVQRLLLLNNRRFRAHLARETKLREIAGPGILA
jgi:hypothetical protein